MELQKLFTFFVVITGVLGWTPEQEAAVDSYINDVYMPINRIPGLVLSIVENYKVVVAKGYGYKNIEKELKADGDTLTCIASITKSFIGTLAVKVLHEKFPELGEKALDTPLNNLLPLTSNITFSDRYRAETMTFRDLLSHRSCLFNPDFDQTFDTVQSIAEKRYRTRYQKESCSFRNGYVYNNALYGLIGELLGDIAGVPIAQLLMEFMQEIGMNESYIIDQDGSFENLEQMSQVYFVRDNKTQVLNPKLLTRVHSMIGAGGILSSAKEMTQFILFHLNLGKVGEKQIIPEEVMKRIYKVSSYEQNLLGKNSSEFDEITEVYGYSLGFINLLVDGWAGIEHGGYWPTFNSELLIIPGLKSGIYLSSNGPSLVGTESGLTHYQLLAKIFDILRGKFSNINEMKPIPNWPVMDEQTQFGFHSSPTINKSDLGPRSKNAGKASDLVGLYGHPTNGDLIVSYDDTQNSLKMKLGQFGTGNLIEIAPLKYKIDWTGDILHMWYSKGIIVQLINHFIDFGYEKKAIMSTDDIPVLIEFTKGASIDTLPPIPWESSSCAP